jgi:phage baseplate assembly protein W
MAIGLQLPFAITTGSIGWLDTSNSEIEAVGYNVKSLLLTNWGERPMHYNMGCNLIEFLFEPVTQDLRQRVGDRIISQLQLWLPYVSVSTLNVVFSSEDLSLPEESIGVYLKFFLNSRPNLSNVVNLVVTA